MVENIETNKIFSIIQLNFPEPDEMEETFDKLLPGFEQVLDKTG